MARRTLEMSSSMTVTVLSPVTGGPFFGELLKGIAGVVGEAGGRVVVLQTLDAGHSRDELLSAPDFAMPTGLVNSDGFISITAAAPCSHLERLRAAGKPVVLASGSVGGFDAPSASPDNRGGVQAAVAHLIAHGHRRIGFAANLLQSDIRERHDAYQAAMRAGGLEPDRAWFFEASDNGEAGGRGAGRALVDAGVPVSALVAATDRNALGLMEELAGWGVAVPQDLAIVGFDGIERGSFSSPTLSTVNQHFDKVGALAARLVLAQLRGEPVASGPQSIPSTFVPRESCGCPRLAGGAGTHSTGAGADAGLADWLRHLLLAGNEGSVADSVLTDELAAFGEAIGQAAETGQEVPVARVNGVAAAVMSCGPSPEELRGVAGAVTEHISRFAAGSTDRSPAGGAALTRCAAQLSAVLWQAQAGAYLDRSASLELAVSEQYDVGLHLLAGDLGEASGLGWMSSTNARVGCLALWDGDPAGGRLRVAGLYEPVGALTGLVGETMTLEQFPPPSMVARGDARLGQLTFVIPVKVGGTDWGLLAVVGTVDATSASGREAFNQWAALLTTSLAAEAMSRQLVEERTLLSAIVGALPHGVCWADSTGTVQGCNQALAELIGCTTPEEVNGRHWAELSRQREVARPVAEWTGRVAAGGDPVINAELAVGPVEDRRSVLVSIVPLPSAAGDGGLLSIWADVTSQRSLEQRLAAASRLESIGQLAAGIAHEINTPMQYIGDNGAFLAKAFGAVTALIDDVIELAVTHGADPATIERLSSGARLELLTARIPQAARQVTEGVEAVSRIVRSLRTFAHPGGEELEPVDLAQLVDSTLAVCRNEWKYVAQVDLAIGADLPAVRAVPGMINQVCLNLIVNASHAIADRRAATGTEELGRITVTARSAGDFAELLVADDGGGIPEPIRERIYDQFFTTKPAGKGTGQGLAICRNIITRHDGTIDFTTSPAGTTFRVRLPLWQPSDAGREMPASGASTATP
jgi:PAS domain S-box-containing protein